MKSSKWILYSIIGLFALIGLYQVALSVFFSHNASMRFGGAGNQQAEAVAWTSSNAMVEPARMSPGTKFASKIYPPSDTILINQLKKRKIIKNADLVLEVTHVDKTIHTITQIINRYKGYIASSQYTKQTQTTGATASLVIRVPAASLTQAVLDIKQLAVRILNATISSQDITKTYYDLKSQLSHLELATNQLNRLLTQATKVKGRLALFKLLAQKEQAISRIQSQMTYYDKAVAMSKISVYLTQPKPQKQKELRTWAISPVANVAFQSLLNSLSNLLDYTILFFIYILPILLTWLIIIWIGIYVIKIIFRISRRKND